MLSTNLSLLVAVSKLNKDSSNFKAQRVSVKLMENIIIFILFFYIDQFDSCMSNIFNVWLLPSILLMSEVIAAL